MIDAAVNAGRIVEALRETEAESEATRVLSGRAVALLHEAGLTRLVSPAAYGGDQLSPRALVEAERIVAHGSTAASWVLMVCAAHTFIAGRLPRDGQDEIFGTDPGMLIPGVPTPRGTCQRAKGGYVLNGRWPYASGADHGDWVLVGCRGIHSVQNPGVQRRVAEASAEIACAWALTQQNCDLLEAAMRREPPMPTPARAQVRWNAAYATELCRRASNRLFEGAGAGAAHDDNVMQIFFRDMNTATHHAMLDFDTNVEIQGKSLLGVELNEAMV